MTARGLSWWYEQRERLKDALSRLTANPSSSVTISTGDGSKSVTWQDRQKLMNELLSVERIIAKFEGARRNSLGLDINYARWC